MIRTLPSRWRKSLLVCARCEKKLGGGFGGDGRKPLSKLLRKLGGGAKGRSTRKADFGVVSVECLKVCPKQAVTIVDGSRPRDWLIVPGGTPFDEVVTRLGLFAAERPGE